jgi:hypothetical protein
MVVVLLVVPVITILAAVSVVGWMAWGYGRDARGAYLDLLPVQMPDSGVYNFVVVYAGNRLENTTAVHWELVGQSASGSTVGLAAAPRHLPATGYHLYLPLVQR